GGGGLEGQPPLVQKLKRLSRSADRADAVVAFVVDGGAAHPASLLAAPRRHRNSGPGEVESEHVGDAVGTKRGHEQAVHAERNAGAAGQSVSERCEQVVIDTRIYGAALAPSCEGAL